MPRLPSMRVADRHGVDHRLVDGVDRLPALLHDAAQVRVADLMAGDGDVDRDRMRERGWPAVDVDPGVAQGLARHLLGGVDGGGDRLLGRLHVDDRTGLRRRARPGSRCR